VLLLAIDTSTTAITVAVHDGSRTLAEATTLDARGHAEHLAPGITRVLAEAGAGPGDLTDIVCGLGPGPFTGLRVGVVTARTLALVTDARLHGLCSLDALAYQAGVDSELFNKLCDAGVVPGAAEPGPDLRKAVAPEVAADER